jgi:hypothetical protein
MFKLIKLNDDLYAVVGKGIDIEGNKEYVTRRLRMLGIQDLEMAMGFDAVVDDDFAEFGVMGRFIFSSNFNKSEAV